jgi:hypothetical protein
VPERSLDWLRQAEKDLEKAKLDVTSAYYEWACFTPAAEGHGLWPWMNAPAFGRDVAPLGREVGATGFACGAPALTRLRKRQ